MAIVLERNNLVVSLKDVSICAILLVLRRDQFFSGPTLMRLANKFSFLLIFLSYVLSTLDTNVLFFFSKYYKA